MRNLNNAQFSIGDVISWKDRYGKDEGTITQIQTEYPADGIVYEVNERTLVRESEILEPRKRPIYYEVQTVKKSRFEEGETSSYILTVRVDLPKDNGHDGKTVIAYVHNLLQSTVEDDQHEERAR